MAGAPHESVWVTLQAHSNIVAVATLLEISAVIITEGAMPDQATISKADEEGRDPVKFRQIHFLYCRQIVGNGSAI